MDFPEGHHLFIKEIEKIDISISVLIVLLSCNKGRGGGADKAASTTMWTAKGGGGGCYQNVHVCPQGGSRILTMWMKIFRFQAFCN